jgi:cold shock CspA family protein/ribosome-associated translation inhibitor RaiA
MESPVKIEFRDMPESAAVREAVEQHVAKLEERYGRVTTGRVVVKGPGERHRTSGHYEINIRLALPDGKEINVERTPPADQRYADPSFALNNAFKRARRQLQDKARRLQGQVKQHEEQPMGTVLRIDPTGEFGFIESSDGQEIYFHRNSVLEAGFPRLAVGSRVTFTPEQGEKGAQASTVKLLGKHSMRM